MSDMPTGAGAGDARRHENGKPAAPGGAGWLALLATPAFAAMAWLTGLPDGPMDMACPVMHGASALGGMLPMYVLMSVFHAAPWLRWLARRRPSQTAE